MTDLVKRIKEAGKSINNYYRLRDRGLSEEEAFEQAKPLRSEKILINIEGKDYSIPQAMIKLNCEVDYTTVMKRIKFGMEPLEAITRPKVRY